MKASTSSRRHCCTHSPASEEAAAQATFLGLPHPLEEMKTAIFAVVSAIETDSEKEVGAAEEESGLTTNSNMEQDGDRLQSQENKPLQPSKVTTYGLTSLSAKILCLKIRVWWLLVLALQSILFIVSIGCLGSPSWMEQEAMDLEGGLFRCTDCPGHWQDGSYDEISGWVCDESDVFDSLCSMFKDLRDAGAVYVFFELLALVGLFAWMFKVMLLLLERVCFPKLRWLPYVFPILSLLSHLLALAAWFGISEASFSDDCDEPDDDRPSVCATHAAALSVFLMLFYALVIVIFLIPYCKYMNLLMPVEKKNKATSGREVELPQAIGRSQ